MKTLIQNRTLLTKMLFSNKINKPLSSRTQSCEIRLNQKYTKFDIYAIMYKQRSKKARSDEIRVRDGGNLSYSYVGKIIKIRNSHNGINNSILIRNTIQLAPVEFIIPFLSPLLVHTRFSSIENKRANAYYLRTTSPVRSKINFDYAEEKKNE